MNEQELLQDLLSEESALRQNATRALWDLWFSQAGEEAELQIREGTQLMDDIQYQKAQEIFENLVIACPLPRSNQKFSKSFDPATMC